MSMAKITYFDMLRNQKVQLGIDLTQILPKFRLQQVAGIGYRLISKTFRIPLMSAHKYPNIFSRQMEVIFYILSIEYTLNATASRYLGELFGFNFCINSKTFTNGWKSMVWAVIGPSLSLVDIQNPATWKI